MWSRASLVRNLGVKPLLPNRRDHPLGIDLLRIVDELQPIRIQIDLDTLDTGQPFQGCCDPIGSLQSVQAEPVDHAFDVQRDLAVAGGRRRLGGRRGTGATAANEQG
jgi:hypothetical protein